MSESDQKVTAHFVMDHSAGEFPVHGVFGGPTPHGKISMALFSERAAIPKEIEMTARVDEHGTVLSIDELVRHGKEGYVRIVSGVYYMDIDTAEMIARWLLVHVAAVRQNVPNA